MEEALKLVTEEADRVRRRGLSTLTFFLGFGTCVLTAFLMGKYPASVWILYSVEAVLILGWRVYHQCIQRNPQTVFGFLDFCWVANFMMTLILFLILVNVLDDLFLGDQIPNGLIATTFPRLGRLFCLFSTGPLGWSVIALGNSLVLHDIDNFSTCFIHLWPSLVTLTMRWDPQLVTAAYPGHFDSLIGFSDPSVGATMLELMELGGFGYLLWWMPFTLWMLVHGRHQSPRKTGHDTVYLDLVRTNAAARKVLGITGACEDAIDASASRVKAVVGYMFVHATLVMISFVCSALCYKYLMLHLAFALVLVCVAMYNGSKRYEWMLLERYKKVISKNLKKE